MSITLVNAALKTLEVRLNELWTEYLNSLPIGWSSTPQRAALIGEELSSTAGALTTCLSYVSGIRIRLADCEPLHTSEEE